MRLLFLEKDKGVGSWQSGWKNVKTRVAILKGIGMKTPDGIDSTNAWAKGHLRALLALVSRFSHVSLNLALRRRVFIASSRSSRLPGDNTALKPRNSKMLSHQNRGSTVYQHALRWAFVRARGQGTFSSRQLRVQSRMTCKGKRAGEQNCQVVLIGMPHGP